MNPSVCSMRDTSDAKQQQSMPAPSASVARLEYFLDSVLKRSLAEEMEKRNRFVDLAAQCCQLRRLCDEMQQLSATPVQPSDPRSPHGSAQRNRILINLGNHFYTPALVTNSHRLHVNIGCGVVLDLDTEEAARHLQKREQLAKAALDRQNRHILRLKYRIRLVTEAIRRLHESITGTAAA